MSQDWVTQLPYILSATNKTSFAGTAVTPFDMIYRFSCPDRLAQAMRLPEFADVSSPDEDAVHPLHHDAMMTRQATRAQSRVQANKKRKEHPPLTVGAMVWMSNHQSFEEVTRSRERKLEPRWVGPYVVLQLPKLHLAYTIRPIGGENEFKQHMRYL